MSDDDKMEKVIAAVWSFCEHAEEWQVDELLAQVSDARNAYFPPDERGD